MQSESTNEATEIAWRHDLVVPFAFGNRTSTFFASCSCFFLVQSLCRLNQGMCIWLNRFAATHLAKPDEGPTWVQIKEKCLSPATRSRSLTRILSNLNKNLHACGLRHFILILLTNPTRLETFGSLDSTNSAVYILINGEHASNRLGTDLDQQAMSKWCFAHRLLFTLHCLKPIHADRCRPVSAGTFMQTRPLLWTHHTDHAWRVGYSSCGSKQFRQTADLRLLDDLFGWVSMSESFSLGQMGQWSITLLPVSRIAPSLAGKLVGAHTLMLHCLRISWKLSDLEGIRETQHCSSICSDHCTYALTVRGQRQFHGENITHLAVWSCITTAMPTCAPQGKHGPIKETWVALAHEVRFSLRFLSCICKFLRAHVVVVPLREVPLITTRKHPENTFFKNKSHPVPWVP